MRLTRSIVIKSALILGTIIAFWGAFAKISHWPSAYPLLIIGMLATLTYMGIAITEVVSTDKMRKPEKVLWILCIVLLSNIAGFLYVFWRRTEILAGTENVKIN